MNKVKIHKALVASLITCSLAITSLAIQQALASNNYNYQTNSWYVDEIWAATYSDEVELTSAPEYSEKTMRLKWEYLNIFREKLWDRIKSIDSEKLKLISEKIDKIIETTKENPRLSVEKQEKILAQLLALKQIIETEIDYDEQYSIDIDLEELFKV